MPASRLLFPLFLIGLLLGTSTAQAAMQVLSLQHRPASEMVPLLAPFLEGDERMAAKGHQLIVQASPERLTELGELLQQLDTPLRRLLITLDESGSSQGQGSDNGISGRISTRHGDILVGDSHGQTQNQVSIRRYSSNASGQGMRSVQALEGQAARISTGQQIIRHQLDQGRHGQPRLHRIEQQLQQGFTVVARVHGNQVSLELDFNHDQLQPQDPRIIQKTSLATRVSGPLGSWIELGDLQHQQQLSQAELLNNSKRYSTEYNNLRIKVEALD